MCLKLQYGTGLRLQAKINSKPGRLSKFRSGNLIINNILDLLSFNHDQFTS
jgi:hypothetical protein